MLFTVFFFFFVFFFGGGGSLFILKKKENVCAIYLNFSTQEGWTSQQKRTQTNKEKPNKHKKISAKRWSIPLTWSPELEGGKLIGPLEAAKATNVWEMLDSLAGGGVPCTLGSCDGGINHKYCLRYKSFSFEIQHNQVCSSKDFLLK